jgi:diguanylate cyclase (GGDEF)-like protein/PAS domain S-box-containing protein
MVAAVREKASFDYSALDFRRIFEATPAPHVVLAPDLSVLAVNDAFLRATGACREAILGRVLCDVFPHNPQESTRRPAANLRAALERVVERGAPDTLGVLRYDLPCPDEPSGFEERYWSAISEPVFSDDGTLVCIVHRTEDVTEFVRTIQRQRDKAGADAARADAERLQAEIFLQNQKLDALNRQLRQSDDRLRIALEGAELAVWTWDPAADRILYQRNMERLFGLSASPTTWEELRRAILPEDREAADAALRRALHDGEDYQTEYRVLWPDGSLHWLAEKGRLHAKNGDTVLMAGMSLDITQRKDTEAALSEAQEQFRLIVDGALDHAILRLDGDGHIRTWNPGAEHIFGFTVDEVIGQPQALFFTPEDRENKRPEYEMKQAIAHGRFAEDRWHLRKDGSRFWASNTISALRDGTGALRGFVKILRDRTAYKLIEEETAYLAHHDALTGLANRAYFSIRLHETLAHAMRHSLSAALMLLDLDRFKQVNDNHGHDTGDLLLKEVGARLLASVRETDVVARLGGDEFVILQANTSSEGSAVLARKIIDVMAQPVKVGDVTINTGASIGIALFPADAEDASELVKNADTAMYRAKSSGRGKYECYSETVRAEPLAAMAREALLREAVDRRQLELLYQPQIDLQSWQITGVEALLHWTDRPWRALRLSDILALAEETGAVLPICEWALNAARAQKKAWADAGLPPFRVAVNFSPRQLDDRHVTQIIERAIQNASTHAPSLECEVDERLLADAGSDASGVNGSRRIPVDALKIDRNLVRHLPHSRSDMAVVASIVELARELHIHTIAAGVETAEQLAAVKSLGCTAAQGYLFSAPVPARELETLLRQGHWSRMNPG